ncbi:MAG: hypothetical protein WC175_03325 [Candidatus Dojkabacteria bacterium]
MKKNTIFFGDTIDWRTLVDEYECPICHGKIHAVLANMYECEDCKERFFINDVRLYEYLHVIKGK